MITIERSTATLKNNSLEPQEQNPKTKKKNLLQVLLSATEEFLRRVEGDQYFDGAGHG